MSGRDVVSKRDVSGGLGALPRRERRLGSRAMRGDTGLAVFVLVALVLLLLILAFVARDWRARNAQTPYGGEANQPGEGVPDRPGPIRDVSGRAPARPPGYRPAEADFRNAIGERRPATSTPAVRIPDPSGERRTSDDTARPRDDWPDRVDVRTGGAEPSGRPPSRVEMSVHDQRIRNADHMVATIIRAVATFRDIVGRNPRDLSELTRPVPGHVEGVFGAAGIPADPWRRPYLYGGRTGSTGAVWVRCLGADGREGGARFDRDIVATFDD